MSPPLDRRTAELADAFLAGQISRRTFISRLLALGLSASAAGAVLAAVSSAARRALAQSRAMSAATSAS